MDRFTIGSNRTAKPTRKLKRAFRDAKAKGLAVSITNEPLSLKGFAREILRRDGGYKQAGTIEATAWLAGKGLL